MNQLQTASTIKKNPFNYIKSKLIAKMMLDGLDKHQINQLCFVDNKIKITSIDRRREVTNEIYRRLQYLDRTLLESLMVMDIVTAKFILLYAIAKSDGLFFEFLSEVYRPTLLGEKKYISMDDFDHFFLTKKETNLIVSEWKPATIDQLAKGYRRMLVESGLGIRNLKNIYVAKMIIHPDIIHHIKRNGDYAYLQAILGER